MISAIPGKFQEGWFAALNVLLALLVFGLHQWIMLCTLPGGYTPFSVGDGVSALAWDETQLYAPGPQRFARSATLPCEMDIVELEGAVNGYPLMHNVLLGSAVWILGSLEKVWIVLHAIFPSCLWLLAYRMLRGALPDRLGRAAIAWGLLLFAFEPRNTLLVGKEALISPPHVIRMPQPALSFLLALAVPALCSATLAAPDRRWGTLACLAGVGAGLTFYAYYFYWVACFLGLGALFLICSAVNRPAAVRLGAILAVGCLVGLPYLAQVYAAQRYGTQRELLMRVGAFHRAPDLTGLVLAVASAVLLTAVMRAARWQGADARKRRALVLCGLCLAFVLGAGAGLNLQVITGYDPQHDHFWNRVIQPFGFLTGILLLSGLVSPPTGARRSAVRVLACAAIGYLLFSAGYRQVSIALRTGHEYRVSSPRYQALLWVRQHVDPGRVVGTLDPELVAMVPGVAGTWNFVPVGDRTMATNEEILTRYVIAARLEGETPQTLGKRLTNRPKGRAAWLVPMYLHFVSSGMAVSLTEADKIFQSLDPRHPTTGRRLDYYILPAAGSPCCLQTAFPRARVVYRNEDWVVYELSPPEA
jgi:hypothetical protein